MNKKRVSIIVSVATITVAIVFLTLYLLGMFSAKVFKITDIDNRLLNQPQAIELSFADEDWQTIKIEDEQKISEIYGIITSRNYIISEEGCPPPGANTYIDFIFNDSETISVNTDYIISNNKLYIPQTTDNLNEVLNQMRIG